jgi:hypothetical protein
MAYTIYNNDGTVLSTIAVGDVDSYSTSLDLIGKNVNNYGEYYNTNLVRLLTSFASPGTEQPRTPQTGQLWFNKTTKRLTVYDGSSFQPTYGSHVSGTAPITTSTGDFWYDTVNSQLKVWDGNSYNLVGPATSGLLGNFGILPPPGPIRNGDTPNPVEVSLINSYGTYHGLIAEEPFNMSASSATIYLPGTTYAAGAGSTATIVRGFTILRDLNVLGDIHVSAKLRINSNQIEGIRTDLTAYYNITPYGSYTATTTTATFTTTGATNTLAYNDANRAISADLAKMFSTSTYTRNSTASVICVYNTTTSVRKFYLTNYLHDGRDWWEPYNGYPYSWTATSTSTVGQVTWLWSTATSTNIVLEGY